MGLAGAANGHWTSFTAAAFATTNVRSGARAMRLNPTGVTKGEADDAAGAAFTSGTQVVRWYVRAATWPSTKAWIVNNARGGGPGFGIIYDSADGKLYTAIDQPSGTITQGATGVAVTTGQYYRLDIKITRAGTTWTVDGQVDGTALGQASLAGQTGGGVNGLCDPFIANTTGTGNVTADINYEDTVTSFTLADYPIGAGHVDHFVPTSDGTHNIAGTGDFQRGNTGTDILNATTTAFQLIDDVPLPSGTVDQADCQRGVAPANPTTDYVECVFGPAPGISTPTVAPRAVEIGLAYHQISTTVGQMQVLLNDNGTTGTIFDSGAVSGTTTYLYTHKHFATPPTGGSWTVSAGAGNFNNLRCRFLAPDANPDQCLDAIMIEAEFAEGGALTLSVGDDLNAAF